MVEFEYQPFKKVIIHEITKIPINQMILEHALAVGEGQIAAPLYWVDGIVFEHGLAPVTDDMINEQLKGILHWSLLMYSDMDDFKEEIVGPYATRMTVFKQEGRLFKDMVKWLKDEYEPSIIES